MSDVRKGQLRRVKPVGDYPDDLDRWMVSDEFRDKSWYRPGYILGILEVASEDKTTLWVVDTNRLFTLDWYRANGWLAACTEVVEDRNDRD